MNAKNSIISSKVEPLYQDYGRRARELKDKGKKLIGAAIPMLIPTMLGLTRYLNSRAVAPLLV